MAPMKFCTSSPIVDEAIEQFASHTIILWHHKLRHYKGQFASTVERFRRADLIDVSLGTIRFGVPRTYVRAVKQSFPNAGFHKRLILLTGRQLLRNPLNPLPMICW